MFFVDVKKVLVPRVEQSVVLKNLLAEYKNYYKVSGVLGILLVLPVDSRLDCDSGSPQAERHPVCRITGNPYATVLPVISAAFLDRFLLDRNRAARLAL